MQTLWCMVVAPWIGASKESGGKSRNFGRCPATNDMNISRNLWINLEIGRVNLCSHGWLLLGMGVGCPCLAPLGRERESNDSEVVEGWDLTCGGGKVVADVEETLGRRSTMNRKWQRGGARWEGDRRWRQTFFPLLFLLCSASGHGREEGEGGGRHGNRAARVRRLVSGGGGMQSDDGSGGWGH
jgi:hypothetical protein